jgi:hypothetical protein
MGLNNSHSKKARFVLAGGCTGEIVTRRGKVILLLSHFWSKAEIDRILRRSLAHGNG